MTTTQTTTPNQRTFQRFLTTMPPMINRMKKILAIGALSLVSLGAAAQQKAGEITHLQGLATAGPSGGQVRFLGVGDAVLEGDVITTTDKGYAIVALSDGSKFTLRPSTTFTVEKFAHNGAEEALTMRLFKGGMRMITGLVGKRNPNGVEMRTSTATIGIRGTSFDARLCGDDCRAEGMTPVAQASTTSGPTVVARVVQLQGAVTAALRGAAARPLAAGAALYEGDEIRTAAGANAVIGFRDQTRVSVNPATAFRIDTYLHAAQGQDDAKDSVGLNLLKGGMRAFTGLIGKKRPDSFTIKTLTATIGIRGTGMDINCDGPCADPSVGASPAGAAGGEPGPSDGLFMLTWEGLPFFAVGPLEVPLNQTGFIGRDGTPRLLGSTPAFLLNFGVVRPDQVEINWENLFAAGSPSGGDGLYIGVRDGHVVILSGGSRIDLGVGESGFVGGLGLVQRLAFLPRFLAADAYPLPELINRTEVPIFQLFGVTLGAPGQEMCRL